MKMLLLKLPGSSQYLTRYEHIFNQSAGEYISLKELTIVPMYIYSFENVSGILVS